MDAVQEGGVICHDGGEGLKQVARFEDGVHTLVDVANKDHGCAGSLLLLAPGEGAGGHEVLHDLDAVLVLELDACNLIEGDAVPEPHQSDLVRAHVVEEVGDRRLTAGNQDGVGGDLLIEVGLAGGAGSQFTQVEVVLHQGQHAGQEKPLLPVGKPVRLHAGGPEQNGNPLVLGEAFAAVQDFVHVDVGHLDGSQPPDYDWTGTLVFLEVVLQLDDAPDAAAQQTVKLLDVGRVNFDSLDPQVGELSLILVHLDIQMDCNAVDDRVSPPFPQDGESLLRLIGTDIVLRQDVLDSLHSVFHDIRIIGGAVLPQKKLQDVDRNIGSFLDGLGQVLADNTTVKAFSETLVQGIRERRRSHSVCLTVSHLSAPLSS